MTLRLVFLGTPAFSTPCLQALLDAPDMTVAGVVTQPDRPAGRGQQLMPSPVKIMAQAAGLPVLQPKSLRKDADVLNWIRSQSPDFFVTIAFGQILSQETLEIPRLGVVNVHASLLPAYRGANPIQRAVMAGDPVTGLTTMLTDAGVDTGAMLRRAETVIGPEETAQEVHDRLSSMAGPLLLDTLRGVADGSISPVPQNHEQATHAPKCDKADAAIDWSLSAQTLHNRIRGLQPWPGAVTTFNGQSVKILKTRLPQAEEFVPNWLGMAPGAIVGVSGRTVWIATGEGPLGIALIQPAGKKATPADDWARGALTKPAAGFS
ncbi:MAG: methionyl-tRNA formyltransferase [Vampirovibrionales bacterium]|nr:methionyl-tRNA formyltransferase [Vampirovibrionales bacterium]